MSDHTPGPWDYIGESQGDSNAEVVWFGDPPSGGATVRGPNCKEDAALIAKAPAMHMLLRQAVDQFMADIEDDEPINGADAVDWLVEFVQRAHEVID